MKNRFALLILALVLAAGPTMASNQLSEQENCKEFDARPILGENPSQGRTQWCFAFQAADLLTFKLKRSVSAFDIALNTSRGVRGTLMQNFLNTRITDLAYSATSEYYGIGSSVIDQALERGLCPGENFKAPLVYAHDLKQNLDSIEDSQRNYLHARRHKLKTEAPEFDRDLFPSLDEALTRKIRESSDSTTVLSQINEAICPTRFSALGIQVRSSFRDSKVNVINEVERAIDETQGPVGIEIDPRVFIGEEPNLNRSAHASTVVARKWNEKKKTCDYLVRNYLGSQCSPEYWLPCEKGDLWLDQDLLSKSISGYTAIK